MNREVHGPVLCGHGGTTSLDTLPAQRHRSEHPNERYQQSLQRDDEPPLAPILTARHK